MKFTLLEDVVIEENILNEATVPMYREMLFNILEVLSQNDELTRLLRTNRSNLEFHHIDGEYELTLLGRKKAKNNKPTNIAILTKRAHNAITKLNKKAHSPAEKIENFNIVLQQYPNEIFDLTQWLPKNIIDSINSEIVDEEPILL